jgi:uncharacterized protein (DUF1330 family)
MSDAIPVLKGYVYVEVDVTDSARYQDYMLKSRAAVEAFGGHFLVRGGEPEVVEGGRAVSRVVIVEFESFERAREFYYSSQYQEAAAMRQGSATVHYYLLHGG